MSNLSIEQVVDKVLTAAHERLQQRCDRDKVIALLADEHGAYDADTILGSSLRSLL